MPKTSKKKTQPAGISPAAARARKLMKAYGVSTGSNRGKRCLLANGPVPPKVLDQLREALRKGLI